MDNSRNDNVLYKTLIVIAILIPLVVGFSYAYFLTNIKGNKTIISGTTSANDFILNLITDNSGYIDATGLAPIQSIFVESNAAKGMFSVSTIDESGTNKNDYPVAYNISLTDITITNGLRDAVKDSFRWSLTCETCADTSNNMSGNFTNLKNLTPSSTSTSNGVTTYKYSEYVLADNFQLIICPDTTETYTLRIWIDWLDDVEQSSVMSQSFSAKVSIQGEAVYLTDTNQCES